MTDARAVWLNPYLSVQRTYDAQILHALMSANTSASKAVAKLRGTTGIGSVVRSAQLSQIQVALHTVIADMFKQVNQTIQAGQHAAAAAVLGASFDWDTLLLNNVYTTTAERRIARANLIGQAPHAIEALIMRLRKGGYPLSQQIYQTRAIADGWLDNAINNAIGRGASWKELAADVKQFINPQTPGGVSYAANRLARTEINNAYHAVSIDHASGSPWVTSMTWRLSNSHPRPDICNTYGNKSFAVDAVPAKPHPQCFCYVVPDVLSEAQFLAAWRRGEYDDYLAATYGKAA